MADPLPRGRGELHDPADQTEAAAGQSPGLQRLTAASKVQQEEGKKKKEASSLERRGGGSRPSSGPTRWSRSPQPGPGGISARIGLFLEVFLFLLLSVNQQTRFCFSFFFVTCLSESHVFSALFTVVAGSLFSNNNITLQYLYFLNSFA